MESAKLHYLLLTLPKPDLVLVPSIYSIWTFQCQVYLHQKIKDAKLFENHLNLVILVFIGKLSLSTFRWVPICQGFRYFQGFHVILYLVKLCTSSIRVKIINPVHEPGSVMYRILQHPWLLDSVPFRLAKVAFYGLRNGMEFRFSSHLWLASCK